MGRRILNSFPVNPPLSIMDVLAPGGNTEVYAGIPLVLGDDGFVNQNRPSSDPLENRIERLRKMTSFIRYELVN